MSEHPEEKPRHARVTAPGEREIRTERTFDAPRERVWRAFTDPTQLARWWGRGHQVDVERMEVRRGGRWRYVEHAPDAAHRFEGRYREVTPPERLVQTFEWDGKPGYVSVNTTELEEMPDGRTRVTTTALFHTGQERDGVLDSGMEEGLDESYEALDEVLEESRG